MNGWDLLPRVVLLLAAAATVGLIMRRLRQDVIVGYLLAGLLVGPTGFGIVQAGGDLAVMSELGAALLLFSIGLEFSLTRLRELGRVAIGAGTVQVLATAAVMFGLGVAAARTTEAIVLGMAFAMSSTAVVLRTLIDRSELESTHGRNSVGVLLLQDVAVIPLLIVSESLTSGQSASGLGAAFLGRLGPVLLFIAGAFLLARGLLPRLYTAALLSGSRELPVVIAVCTTVGAAWLAHALGFSPSLGAFIAGIVLAESPFAAQLRADLTPLSAVFITLFFASIGTLVDLPMRLPYLGLLLAATIVTMLVKATIAAAAVYAFQRSLRPALITGLAISQVGEFTFVLAQVGHRRGLVGDTAFQLTLGISMLSLLATPYVIALAPRLAAIVLRRIPAAARAALAAPAIPRWRRVIVVGYGPAGQDAVDELQNAGVALLVLEMNPNTVQANRSVIPIELGDATQPEILQHAGIGQSLAMIITIPDPAASRAICRTARHLAPSLPIVVRSRYHQHTRSLIDAGADRVVDEEHLVGARLAGEAVQAIGEVAVPGARTSATRTP